MIFLSGRARRRLRRGSRPIVVVPRGMTALAGYANGNRDDPAFVERLGAELARVSKQLAEGVLLCNGCGDHGDQFDRGFVNTVEHGWLCGNCLAGRASRTDVSGLGDQADGLASRDCHDQLTVEAVEAGTRRLVNDVFGRNSNF